MGKGARNRQIKREATEMAALHGGRSKVDFPTRVRILARMYRKEVLKYRRRKQPSKMKGPHVSETKSHGAKRR